jgi:4-hydroxybenzoate polyprenyltransferase
MIIQQKSFYIPFLIFALLAFPLIYGYQQGLLTPRTVGIGFLLIMGCLLVVLLQRYRDLAKDRIQPRTTKPSAEVATAKRKLKVIVVVLFIAMFAGLRSTQGAPAIPRLIGVAVSVSLISLCVFLLFKARKLS